MGIPKIFPILFERFFYLWHSVIRAESSSWFIFLSLLGSCHSKEHWLQTEHLCANLKMCVLKLYNCESDYHLDLIDRFCLTKRTFRSLVSITTAARNKKVVIHIGCTFTFKLKVIHRFSSTSHESSERRLLHPKF